jgi:hypothetical protein
MEGLHKQGRDDLVHWLLQSWVREFAHALERVLCNLECVNQCVQNVTRVLPQVSLVRLSGIYEV